MSAISKRVVKEFADKDFRDEYVTSRVKRWIASQIRALRQQPGREWSQGELAEKLRTAQSNVSRLENVDYGKFTLQTLLDLASAFDVALQVKFVDHMTFLTGTSDITPDKLTVASYDRVANVMNRVFLGEVDQPKISVTIGTSQGLYEGASIVGSTNFANLTISAAASTMAVQQNV